MERVFLVEKRENREDRKVEDAKAAKDKPGRIFIFKAETRQLWSVSLLSKRENRKARKVENAKAAKG